MSNHLPVLIIGAGPTGLMMACELKRHDIPFRIIDKKSTRTQGSNATWVQTRTLEIFDAMGIADRFLKIGHQCDAINLYANGERLVNIPFDKIDSIYPFVLMLSQSDTERLLNERLEESNNKVEREVELIDVKQTKNGVESTVRYSDGHTEGITSNWVIACDGINSTVRNKCQITFPGNDLPEQFMVADAQMSTFLPHNEMHVFFDKGTIFPDKGTLFTAFPWGENKYRICANLYQDAPRQSFAEHEVREVVAERTYGNYVVDSISWISPFWIHCKIMDQMRLGPIFFAGDAAHTHSPLGGQGMNTGLQDAHNLAWKLALVIKEKANKSLLDSYQLERYPIVNETVNQTEFLTNMALFDNLFFDKLQKFTQKISQNSNLSTEICTQLTQLSIQYKESPVIDASEMINKQSPQPGERAPNVIMNNSKKMYDYINNTLHNVLLFTGNKPTKDDLTKLKELQKSINIKFADLVKVSIIASEEINDAENIILDTEGAIHQRYNIKAPYIYINRPDDYIAYCSKKLDSVSVENFLQQYLISSS